MWLQLKPGSARSVCLLAIAAAYLSIRTCGQCADDGGYGNPADPGIDPLRLEELARVSVPSIRAALAENPSLSDDLLWKLAEDPYDSVAHAALAAWKARYPSGTRRVTQRDAGKTPASPDSGELREMIRHNQGVEAALEWRHLPASLRSSLVDVCHWDKADGDIGPLLDFVAMAEPPGGPLASSMFFQLVSDAPGQIPEMRKRGLLLGISSYGLFVQAIEARRPKTIRFFADTGLSLNERGDGGETPLMAAARTGDVEMILLLLGLGADADARDDNSLSASDYARRALKVDAAEFLARDARERTRADNLKRRFSRAPQDSPWVGRWEAASGGVRTPAFTAVTFGMDGTFDMPPRLAGGWQEVDPTHLVATPMIRDEGPPGASRTLFGDLSFVRLENPTRLQVKFYGEQLEFQPQSEPAGPDAKALAMAPAMGPRRSPVAAPTGLKATATLERMALSWNAAPDATGYFIYRDGALLSSRFVSEMEFSDDVPPPAASATYEVQAFDSAHHVSPRSEPLSVATILKDTDGKGMPDRWQMLHFGHLGVDPNADPDGDGLTNLEEFKGGSDPNDFYNGVEPLTEALHGGNPGPQDELALIVRHPDGRPWEGAPTTFRVTSGRRRVSAVRNQPPYVDHIVLRTDRNGLAQCYLEPQPKP